MTFTWSETLSDEEKARRERRRIHGSGIMSYQWSADGSALFPLAGDVCTLNLVRQGLSSREHSAYETDVKFSPNSNYVYVGSKFYRQIS